MIKFNEKNTKQAPDLLDFKDACTAKDIYPLIEWLHDTMGNRDYSIVDSFLENAPIEKISNLVMVSIIRTTFSMKRRLTKWFFVRDRIAKELSSRGENSASILKGLYSDSIPDCAALNKLIGLEEP